MKPLAQVYEESVWSPMPEAIGHRDRHNRALEAVAAEAVAREQQAYAAYFGPGWRTTSSAIAKWGQPTPEQNFDGNHVVDNQERKHPMPSKVIVLEEDAYNKLKSGSEWLIAEVRALYSKLTHYGHTAHANPATAAASADALESHIATVTPVVATAPEPAPVTLASVAVYPPVDPVPGAAVPPPLPPVVPVGVSEPSEAATALAS